MLYWLNWKYRAFALHGRVQALMDQNEYYIIHIKKLNLFLYMMYIIMVNINDLDIDFKELPDTSETKYILLSIIDILEYINNVPSNMKQNIIKYHDMLFEKYQNFSNKYFNLFMMIIEEKYDYDMLITLLKIKAAIELNKIDSVTGDDYIHKLLSDKYFK